MGTVKVRALTAFFDRQANTSRAEGEEFEASAERVGQLNACGAEQGGEPLVAEVPPEPAARPRRAGRVEE